MYTLTAANSPHDLPLYQRLYPASRHDAVSFVLSSVEFMQRFTLGTVKRVLLDSAHDAKPIYDLLLDQDINPLIDLNLRTSASPKAIRNLKVSYNGRPICAAGLEMKHHGSDRARMVDKWLCPKYRQDDSQLPNSLYHRPLRENVSYLPQGQSQTVH